MSTVESKIRPGATVSHYRILEELGQGGMGVVFKAEDPRLRTDDPRLQHFFALKFISPDQIQDEIAKRRFTKEALAGIALDHMNICKMHAIDETPDGQLFICMSFYDGESIDKLLSRGPVPERLAIDIVSQMAAGLACAHAHGIIHRDIKPANVMLTQDNVVKIMDFGLAKLLPGTTVTRVPDSGPCLMGTCAYMSPEQASGGEVDDRSDLFSLGIVFYELLTGKRPFEGEHWESVLYQIQNATPRPLSSLRGGLNPQLQRIVDKCLQKDPSTRYQSANELREDLQRVAVGTKLRWARLPRRHARRATVVSLIAGVAALAGLSPWTHGVRQRIFGGVPAQLHVAVLPFENVGQDPINQAFCDGLMETLASQLTQLEQFRESLWVVPTSVVRAEKVASPAEARKRLNVNLVVTGAVQRFADHVRVTLSLVDVAQGATPRQVNSILLDNTTWKMDRLQDEAAMRMARMMDLQLLPREEKVLAAGTTAVPVAYDFYLQGVGYVRAFEVEGNLDRAVSAFSMAIDRDSSYALAHAGLGEAYWRKYKDTQDVQWIEHAQAHAARAVALDSLIAPAHVTLGLVRSGTGHAESAVHEFRRAIALDPASADAYRGLATAFADAEQPGEAEATYRKAIAMKPDYWGGHHDFGMFYYRQGEYAKALEQFAEVARLNPENKFAYNNMGGCYWALDQLDKARDMFQRSIDAEPNARAYTNLGAYYSMKQSWAESARMCEKALQLNPGDYKTFINLGNAYYWIPGQRDAAMEAYRKAVDLMETQRKLTPRNTNLLTSLEGCYAVLGESDRARALIDETMRIDPKSERVLYFAGHSCEQMGERDRALDYIGKAIDAGYPLTELEDDPWLHDLRDDTRYAALHERGVRTQKGNDEK